MTVMNLYNLNNPPFTDRNIDDSSDNAMMPLMNPIHAPYVRADTPGERIVHGDNERFGHLAHLTMCLLQH